MQQQIATFASSTNNNNNNNALSQKKSSIPSKSFCWWFVCFNCDWFSVGTKERAGILFSIIDQQTTTTKQQRSFLK
jgi:hypothetical protein